MRAVSSSDRPVSGRGSPPSPSSESSTILVVFATTSWRISDLLAISEVRPHGRRGLEDLARHPLARDELKIARARVVDDRVAPDVVERGVARHVARRAADHDAELHLPVELAAAARAQDRIARADDRGAPFGEDRRLLRDRLARLERMIPVVEADADELAGVADRRVQ